MTIPEDLTHYDDGPPDRVWGYDWQAHLAADAAGWALVVGSVASLAWLTLAGGPAHSEPATVN